MCKVYFLLLLFVSSFVHAAEEEKQVEEGVVEEAIAPVEEPAIAKPDREEQMSKLIEKHLDSGEAIWLGNVDDAFLALYKEDSSRKTQGGILILHDLGANADWPQLINPLRLKLAKKGWHTLSIQLPMVSSDVDKEVYLRKFDEAITRVNLGIEQLKQKDVKNIVIIGHGMGAAIGTFYLSQTPNAEVAALVTISLVGQNVLMPKKQSEPVEEDLSSPEPVAEKEGVQEGEKKAEVKAKAEEKAKEVDKELTAEPTDTQTASVAEEPLPDRELFVEMGKIEIPFLDLYAQQDHQDVLREAQRRVEIMRKSENQNYFQWELEGADHYFRGHEDTLTKRLRGWLKKHAKGM